MPLNQFGVVADPIYAGQGGLGFIDSNQLKPQIWETLVRGDGETLGISFADFTTIFGMEMAISQDVGSHYEIHRHEAAGVVGTITAPAGAPGAAATFELQSVNTGLYGNSGNNSYVQVNETFELLRLGQQVIVTAVNPVAPNAFQITVVPTKSAADGGDLTGLVAGDNFSSLASAWEYGSDTPEGQFTQPHEVSFELQIMKLALTEDGSAFNNQLWYGTQNTEMGTDRNQYSLNAYTYEIVRRKREDRLLVATQKITNPLVTTNRPSTSGIIERILDFNGWVFTYGAFGMTWGDFDLITQAIRNNKGCARYMGMHGQNFGQMFENMNLAQYSNVTNYDAYLRRTDVTGSGEAIANALRFKSIKKDNHIFDFMPAGIFNDPDALGQNDSPYLDLAVMMPITSDPNPLFGRRQGGFPEPEAIPSFAIRYKGLGDGNRRYARGTLAGLNGLFNQQVFKATLADQHKMAMLSHIGLQTFGTHRFGLIAKAGTFGL